jgi:hypothetical protein
LYWVFLWLFRFMVPRSDRRRRSALGLLKKLMFSLLYLQLIFL